MKAAGGWIMLGAYSLLLLAGLLTLASTEPQEVARMVSMIETRTSTTATIAKGATP